MGSILPDGNVEGFWRVDVVCCLDRSMEIEGGESSEYILGHLVNFPSLLGRWLSYSGNTDKITIHEARARVVLETGEWKVTIDSVSNISELLEEISISGGYAITSSIKIEHSLKDENSMSMSDVDNINKALYFFLSFAVGRYTPIVLPIGYNSLGLEVWREWNDWLIPQWEKTTSWFSATKNCESLTQAFPGFMKIWSEPNSIWREPIKHSIFWYVESGRTSVDPTGKIIWVQSALELLSWTYFVTTGKKSKTSFNNLGGACEKIRAFLDELEIPTSFSNMSVNLDYITEFIEHNKLGWQEATGKQQRNLEDYLYLKAFIEVRNEIVHPRNRYESVSQPSDSSDYDRSFWLRVEALNLGLWYLEMSLLRLFEYKGSYVSRLQNHEIKDVPWVE